MATSAAPCGKLPQGETGYPLRQGTPPMSSISPAAGRAPHGPRAPIDPVGLSWLVTVRWTTLGAAVAAVLAGRSALAVPVPLGLAFGLLALAALSNLWLMWSVRAERTAGLSTAAGSLVCGDVALLSFLLSRSGGVLNPASVVFLVQIVLAALVLGRAWTWIVTALSVGGYAALFLSSTSGLNAAQMMHPEIGLHMRGMWLAFALTALIVAILVTRLAIAVERRDRALADLRERTARASRFAGLATLATGAAHELSTPLATIAVAARELERALARQQADGTLREDARLIRAEADRCRRLLDDLAGRLGEPAGQAPLASSLADVLSAVLDRLSAAERTRVRLEVEGEAAVRWPTGVVAPAVANLVRNGLQASAAGALVHVAARPVGDCVHIVSVDRGRGMTADELARAGEPFFTTKSPGAGTGLGLFVTRSIAEQLGGSLTLSSTPGRGTTATIVLPRDVVAPAAAHG